MSLRLCFVSPLQKGRSTHPEIHHHLGREGVGDLGVEVGMCRDTGQASALPLVPVSDCPVLHLLIFFFSRSTFFSFCERCSAPWYLTAG
ncbi:hypothetical protein CesoFtcFv8_022515 [Champsocephalus esox]|uniref:Uncharacterized protein n=2 Tax=Champsocephalus TaxID=52236 RepID=A0AAN8H8Y1_CHAGU|nr:hypothetical protein CesoFtcFv8_022515 [Champsocephalus esox]KAK5906457.1 hypothetical protein CgunFtcFv8_002322 [Champsocephalus gunnari]